MKKWARDFDRCIQCLTTDNKYNAKGLCILCYKRKLYRTNIEFKERVKKESRQWKADNPEKKKEMDRQWKKKWYKKKMAILRLDPAMHEIYKNKKREISIRYRNKQKGIKEEIRFI